jgi:hypothetical protein
MRSKYYLGTRVERWVWEKVHVNENGEKKKGVLFPTNYLNLAKDDNTNNISNIRNF